MLIVGQSSYKTPTCVLVDGYDNFVAFGYEAETKYAEYEADKALQKTQELHLFRQFKMKLYNETNDQRLSKHMSVLAVDGYLCQATQIFAMALSFLKEHLLEALKVNSCTLITANAVKWVVTVPAIWKDDAKQFMREAAFTAGLINNSTSGKLLIALEPEVASIFCRSLKINDFKQRGGTTNIESKEGTKYIVVDAGGGTVDVTVHEIISNSEVKEVLPPSGGAWGGTKVDENFINVLGDVLGSEFLDRFRKQDPVNWMSMLLTFQTVKCSIDGKKDVINIAVPAYQMENICKKVHGKKPIEKVVNSRTETTGVRFNNGHLILDKTCRYRLFDGVILNIVGHIKTLLENLKLSSCNYVFLVGGFANNSILFETLQTACVNVEVLVPPDPQIAVLKGAVMFGHNPGVISARIARRTYGLSLCTKREQWHRQDTISARHGVEYCTKMFEVLLEKDEEVRLGTVKQFSRSPWSIADAVAYCEIIASDMPSSDFKYTDEPGVEVVGTINVELQPIEVKSADHRPIKYDIKFGETEIHVLATDVLTGRTNESTIDFMVD